MLSTTELAPSPTRLAAVERAWSNLIGPGTELTAAERHAVIGTARRAWANPAVPPEAATPMDEATHWLAVDAEGLRPDVIDDFERRGLDRWRYLEVVGVVGRLANIDFYARGLGAPLPRLPEPVAEPPSGHRHPDAAITNMWVPTVGDAYAPLVLDALPSEGEALRDLHEPMYIDFGSIGDGAYRDELSKTQIEYLAARASYLNECFY